MEEWKDIRGFKGLYQISNKGNVKALPKIIYSGKNHKTKRIYTEILLKPTLGSTNYPSVSLCKNGKIVYKRVNRLVAKAFVPNPKRKPQVNHKDGNKLNNNDWNLEWNTAKENVIHANETYLTKHRKVVNQYNKEGKFIKEFPSAAKAGQILKIPPSSILRCIKNHPHFLSAGGFIWKLKL